jgi:hypothetical protein
VKIFWVPGHSGVERNEKADELARMGSDSQFCGPKPCLALPTTVAKSKIKDWVTQSHDQNWRIFHPNDQPSRKTALYFLGLSRIRLRVRMVLSLITGHCRLNGHLSKMKLHSDPICGGCLLEEETASHFICTYPSLAQKRQKVFGKPILDKVKISEILSSDILKFAMLSKRFSTDP